MLLNRIYNLDCIEGMKQLPDSSVNAVVTSPPYDKLRKYGNVSFDFEKFKIVANEISRILVDGGICLWVVQDQTIKHSESGTSFRQALYFKDECGLNLYDTMIFNKLNPIPRVHRRYNQVFDYMFLFSKGCPNTFNPILESCKRNGQIQEWGRNINIKEKTSKHFRLSDKRKTKAKKIRGNIFSYGVGHVKSNHPAIFPLKLAIDQIKTWTKKNDIVLDPFIGSGTTAVASIMLQRQYIGFEINKDYYEDACRNISRTSVQYNLFME